MDKKRILWVDDEITSFRKNVSDLSKTFDVTVADSSEDASDLLRKKIYDFYIFDMDLSSDLRGRDLANQVRNIDKDVPIAFLTSYVSNHELNSIPNRSDSLSILSKRDFLQHDSDQDLSTKISALLAEFLSKTSVDKPTGHRLDPFKISLMTYKSLSKKEQLDLLREAKSQLKFELEKAFSDGYVWALFCGSSSKPILRETSIKNIPNHQKISNVAKQFDAVPYSFARTDLIEDIAHSSCSQVSGLDSYPKISMNFPGFETPEMESVEFHFDTGSQYSYLSLDLYQEVFTNVGDWPTLIEIGGVDFAAHKVKIEVLIAGQEGGPRQSIAASLSAFAIESWHQCCLARKCDPSCKNWRPDRVNFDVLCRRRGGLIGREFLSDNDLSITISGSETHFSRNKNKRF